LRKNIPALAYIHTEQASSSSTVNELGYIVTIEPFQPVTVDQL